MYMYMYHVFYLVPMQVFFSVVLGSFSLGNALPELETFATAFGSAAVVFDVINKVRHCV